jgi:hypothetical protein
LEATDIGDASVDDIKAYGLRLVSVVTEKGCRGDNLSLCGLQKAKHPRRGISAVEKWLAVSILRALL